MLSSFSCSCTSSSSSVPNHLFSSAPPLPSFNDPLPPSSLSSSLSLPKRTSKTHTPPTTTQKNPSSSFRYRNYQRPNNQLTQDDQLVQSSARSYRFRPHSPNSRFPSLNKMQDPDFDDKALNRPAFKATHLRTKYHKPVNPVDEPTVISGDKGNGDDRSVLVTKSGVSYRLPGAPFDFQFSYSETPAVAPIAIREPAFLPFAPPSMPRPWTGKAPLLSKKEKEMKKGKKLHLVEPLGSKLVQEEGLVKQVFGKKGLSEQLRLGLCNIKDKRSREEVLGEPLTKLEIQQLLRPHLRHNRQVNLGRDGLTHNMLELVHCHWRRDQVCKVRCRGVPTIDMQNICKCLEDKTGGKVIHKSGGIIFLFRGRHYNPRLRPRYPIMLWKPATPVYPKLIQKVPEGLTKEEAVEMREKGQRLLPICKLAKNGIYINLVKDVRNAFEGSELVKIDCEGMHGSDYKKLAAKLKELVPCVLLSFDNEQILIYRGKNWKSQYKFPLFDQNSTPNVESSDKITQTDSSISGESNDEKLISSKMLLLYNRAIESSKALKLKDSELSNLDPNSLLEKVEEFEYASQALKHSESALIVKNEDENQVDLDQEEEIDQDEINENECDDSVPYGSLPIDIIIGKLGEK